MRKFKNVPDLKNIVFDVLFFYWLLQSLPATLLELFILASVSISIEVILMITQLLLNRYLKERKEEEKKKEEDKK